MLDSLFVLVAYPTRYSDVAESVPEAAYPTPISNRDSPFRMTALQQAVRVPECGKRQFGVPQPSIGRTLIF
jgi:hypothetical protein